MESPWLLNQEDEQCRHYFTQVNEEQDGTLTGTERYGRSEKRKRRSDVQRKIYFSDGIPTIC